MNCAELGPDEYWEYGVAVFGDIHDVDYPRNMPWLTHHAAVEALDPEFNDRVVRRIAKHPGPWQEVAS